MKKSKYRTGSVLKGLIPMLVIFTAVAVMVFQGFRSAGDTVDEEGLKSVEESIRRGVVTCYSIENRYPDSYQYLADNYGLNVDTERYVILYDVFATNIMPTITVLAR